MRNIIYPLLCLSFLSNCESNNLSIKHWINEPSVAIQPFDGFPNRLIKEVVAAIDSLYDIKIEVLAPIALPKHAFYKPRQRYRADSLIRYLQKIKPEKYTKIIGLTEQDISTTKGGFKDYGIMGLAFVPGSSSIVSTYRVRRGAKNTKHLKERLHKVTCHKLGHNFGLPHCVDSEKCVMRSARGKASNIDNYNFGFCDICSSKTSTVLKSYKD